MLIETQITADPEVINFFPPVKLLASGRAEFVDAKSMRKSPLAEALFDIGGIKSIFMTEELISVTKETAASWEDLKPQILAEIMDHISLGEQTVIEPQTPAETETEDIIGQIIGLLNARIRPAVRQDGGDIIFKGFDNGIVYVEMKGNCVGCPYALVTLKEGVEKVLKTYIPQVKEVRNFEKEKENGNS